MDKNRRSYRRLLLDRHFGLDRVRDETILVREVVHLIEILVRRLIVAGEFQLRMQLHFRDRHFPIGIFLHVANGIVGVFIEHELLLQAAARNVSM